MWVVGLKENQTVDDHLTLIGRPILSIENRPEIPGYTVSVSENDTELIEAIRSDPSVGFVVKVSQNYFHKHEKFVAGARNGDYDNHFTMAAESWGYENDEDFLAEFLAEEIDEMVDRMSWPSYYWYELEREDPEAFDLQGIGRREPLEWVVQLEKGYNIDEHINVITQFNPHSVTVSSSSSSSEEYERISLPLMRADSRVESVWPGRCHQPGCQLFTSRDGKNIPAWKDPCLFSLGYRQWEKTPVFSADSYPTVDFWGEAPYRSHETELPPATGYPWWLTR
ncbi:hypothetical protein D6C98_02439 [Aureobasidium pullulans]|uniref:Uncharacterized protein n=1 Tax=Aureobasidium pullulans TaxID=5580 RepID=A0A4S9NXC4_AURPU|nr:hypothetical protein D6C98_02439 [Aureobasidium pullulans]THZ74956.1 hypothetical protein D6C85_03169 [Aureobasidium pullulans]